MRRWPVLVSVLLIAASQVVTAWGPLDPMDAKEDPDNDKLGNLAEFRAGTNPLVPDTDTGGCWDGWEVTYGLDPTNPADDMYDTDNDGWTNYREFLEGTNPLNPNTDNDRYPLDSTDPNPLIPDENGGPEPGPVPYPKPPTDIIDTDNDTLADCFEPELGTDPYNWDSDGDKLHDGLEYYYGTDANDRDTDDDGLWDGQEVWKMPGDRNYTGTSPLKADSDGDGIGDAEDDTDGDGMPNWAEWRYDPVTGEPLNWTSAIDRDTDDDGVWDGQEVFGNPRNGDQTSDPLLPDTDGDHLWDGVDPHTWVVDHLPRTRLMGGEDFAGGPLFPTIATKGVPFNVEGVVEYNVTSAADPGGEVWRRIEAAMVVQVWIVQDGVAIPISDPVITGEYGQFKVVCTIGDQVRAGIAMLLVTIDINVRAVYLPSTWDEVNGNRLP